MLEADLSDGNLAELTQAITNALKPQVPQVRYITAPVPKTLNGANEAAPVEEEEDFVEGETDEADDATASTVKAARPITKRKYKQPELVELDWTGTGGPTFKDFAKEKSPKSKARKYLVATFWLKEYGGHPTVNADKIYSSFRTAGWPVGFGDWAQPFHNLVHSDHMRKGANAGEYSITTIGEGLLEQAEN
jgi:hypothetical protein